MLGETAVGEHCVPEVNPLPDGDADGTNDLKPL
jgi:hypothetical protein